MDHSLIIHLSLSYICGLLRWLQMGSADEWVLTGSARHAAEPPAGPPAGPPAKRPAERAAEVHRSHLRAWCISPCLRMSVAMGAHKCHQCWPIAQPQLQQPQQPQLLQSQLHQAGMFFVWLGVSYASLPFPGMFWWPCVELKIFKRALCSTSIKSILSKWSYSSLRSHQHATGCCLTCQEGLTCKWIWLNLVQRKKRAGDRHTPKGMQQHDDSSFWMRDGVLDADLSRSSFVLVSNGFSM